jgi:DNA-binding PadR family transcriptional regulator
VDPALTIEEIIMRFHANTQRSDARRHHPPFADRRAHDEARFRASRGGSHDGPHRGPRGGHRRGPFPGAPFPGGPEGGPFEGPFGGRGHGGPEGHAGHGGPRGGHRRGRAPRGDVRAAVLQLLAEQPMHGYQLMQAIAERSGGRWTPSPGAIYPTISQLEDEGLVTVVADAGRKLATITDAGRKYVQQLGDPFAAFADAGPRTDLRGLVEQVIGAVRQVGRTGSEAQAAAAAGILADARRALYLLLADGPDAPSTPESPGDPTSTPAE